ncbi:MAG TPA: 3'-5' exonuclease [Opitutaceae bacterium]|nr:3'-5' exonuclease [Opitutaceae bacterium]
MATGWTGQPIFFLDFEGSLASGILEYGVVALLGGEIAETKTRLCRATGRVRPEDVAVHGLSAGAVAAQAPFGDDWEYFAGLRERGPFAAHYAHVENSLLKAVWPYPRTSPDFARPGERAAEWGPWIDTGRLYAQFHPELPSGKLEELVRVCGLQAELEARAVGPCPAMRRHYHAALYDALAGALLLARLAAEPALGNKSVAWLLAMSTLNPEKRDALRQKELF